MTSFRPRDPLGAPPWQGSRPQDSGLPYDRLSTALCTVESGTSCGDLENPGVKRLGTISLPLLNCGRGFPTLICSVACTPRPVLWVDKFTGLVGTGAHYCGSICSPDKDWYRLEPTGVYSNQSTFGYIKHTHTKKKYREQTKGKVKFETPWREET